MTAAIGKRKAAVFLAHNVRVRTAHRFIDAILNFTECQVVGADEFALTIEDFAQPAQIRDRRG